MSCHAATADPRGTAASRWLSVTSLSPTASPSRPPRKCPDCGLVQLYRRPPVDPFGPEYPFRQGTSKTWVAHLNEFIAGYCGGILPSTALDIGANDGTLVELMAAVGIDTWGVDPSPQTRNGRVGQGHFGREWAGETWDIEPLDLITAFNVLAHVSDLDDFLGGVTMLLAPTGRFVVEVPDWRRSSWDQVYHEHQSYFDGFTLFDALTRRGLKVLKLEEIDTHGGSLRATCHRAP